MFWNYHQMRMKREIFANNNSHWFWMDIWKSLKLRRCTQKVNAHFSIFNDSTIWQSAKPPFLLNKIRNITTVPKTQRKKITKTYFKTIFVPQNIYILNTLQRIFFVSCFKHIIKYSKNLYLKWIQKRISNAVFHFVR